MKELQFLRKSITLVKAKRLDSAPNRPVVADGWSTCIGRYVSGERMRFILWLCIHFFLKVQEMMGIVGCGDAGWAGSTTPLGELSVDGWYSDILMYADSTKVCCAIALWGLCNGTPFTLTGMYACPLPDRWLH